MPAIIANKVWLRVVALALFTIAMLGPWAFDQINVPAQYPCDRPFVRLYGDFCGFPMSGFGVVKWGASGFSTTLAELIQGNIAGQIPQLLFLVGAGIVFLPFFSILLLIWKRDSRRLQTFNVILCALAGLLVLALFILQANSEQFARYFSLLWGPWLYILLVTGAIFFEVLGMRLNSKPTVAV